MDGHEPRGSNAAAATRAADRRPHPPGAGGGTPEGQQDGVDLWWSRSRARSVNRRLARCGPSPGELPRAFRTSRPHGGPVSRHEEDPPPPHRARGRGRMLRRAGSAPGAGPSPLLRTADPAGRTTERGDLAKRHAVAGERVASVHCGCRAVLRIHPPRADEFWRELLGNGVFLVVAWVGNGDVAKTHGVRVSIWVGEMVTARFGSRGRIIEHRATCGGWARRSTEAPGSGGPRRVESV
jgi:hypothetical protein